MKLAKYAHGGHPNSRRNLQSFRKGYDPRRWTGGGRTKDRQRKARFNAIAELLQSDALTGEEREALLRRILQDVLDGALTGDRVLLNRIMEGALRGWW